MDGLFLSYLSKLSFSHQNPHLKWSLIFILTASILQGNSATNLLIRYICRVMMTFANHINLYHKDWKGLYECWIY